MTFKKSSIHCYFFIDGTSVGAASPWLQAATSPHWLQDFFLPTCFSCDPWLWQGHELWGCLTSPTFFFFGWQLANLIGPSQKKKLKLWMLPKIEDSMESESASPSYIGEKGRTLGKTYGIKVRCYWEHIENLKGTCWE